MGKVGRYPHAAWYIRAAVASASGALPDLWVVGCEAATTYLLTVGYSPVDTYH